MRRAVWPVLGEHVPGRRAIDVAPTARLQRTWRLQRQELHLRCGAAGGADRARQRQRSCTNWTASALQHPATSRASTTRRHRRARTRSQWRVRCRGLREARKNTMLCGKGVTLRSNEFICTERCTQDLQALLVYTQAGVADRDVRVANPCRVLNTSFGGAGGACGKTSGAQGAAATMWCDRADWRGMCRRRTRGSLVTSQNTHHYMWNLIAWTPVVVSKSLQLNAQDASGTHGSRTLLQTSEHDPSAAHYWA